MIHRRDMLAAAAASAALPAVARAQGSEAAPRFHALRVGALPVTIVQDGTVLRPDVTRGLVVNAQPEQVAAALSAGGVQGTRYDNPYNQTVVGTRSGLVLIDTGNGQGGAPGTGQMFAALRAAGLDPSAVTTVLFTHFHPDHVGGLLNADGSAAFPNAAIKVPAREWAYWNDSGEESRATEFRRPNFANARRRFAPYAAKVEQFGAGAEVASGITAVSTPGHSPGHTSFLVSDGPAQLMVIGDVVTAPPVFMANPEWYPPVDMDPTQAVATRKALLDRVAADRVPIIGYHFPLPATGQVERAGSGYRLVPGDP
ncbi:MBL fold metallo-hydrolase [Muricoccus radiodurans]|uniref:MBL fold metallo-hydrolase n=1 Tax=Muricoccus radiodurans TaxID=2231721 RepID=UPI003CF41704